MSAICFSNSDPLAIESLIVDRSCELGLGRPQLVQRAGYKNIAKGLRRLNELLAGELNKTKSLIRALAPALELPSEAIHDAIDRTERQIAEAREAAQRTQEKAWRAAFKPHAIIFTQRRVPQPVFVAALIGIDRLLRIDFDLNQPPASYASQAFAGFRKKLREFNSDSSTISETIPAFGRATGIIVNYSPERAVRFDLDGTALEIISHAYRPGDAHIEFRGQPISTAMLRAIIPIE